MEKYKGYCATFAVDREGDRFLPGCFIVPVNIPILYEHKHIIGNVIYIKEDAYGLFVEFIIHKSLEKNKYFLSLGFKTLEEEVIFYRHLKKVRIYEVSIVKDPAQLGTYLVQTKIQTERK